MKRPTLSTSPPPSSPFALSVGGRPSSSHGVRRRPGDAVRYLAIALLAVLVLVSFVKMRRVDDVVARIDSYATLEEKIMAKIAEEEEEERQRRQKVSHSSTPSREEESGKPLPGDIDGDGLVETHREEENALKLLAFGGSRSGDDDGRPRRSFYDVVTNDPLFAGTKISKYIAKRGKVGLPILVLCYNRAEQLGQTLDVLLSKVRHVTKDAILVAQDDAQEETANEARRRSLMLIQNMHNSIPGQQLREGGQHIAQHYGYAISEAFKRFPEAPAIVILEDDLRPSPDFMEWMVGGGAMGERDGSIWCVSAWNDNGFFEKYDLDADVFHLKYKIKRTILFPGLGWLLYRDVWESDLSRVWPKDQWDWIVRGIFIRKNRECLYPEISRTYHAGKVGTFITADLQANYFDKIVINRDEKVTWASEEGLESLRELKRYEEIHRKILTDPSLSVHVSSARDLEGPCSAGPASDSDLNTKTYVVWYEADIDPQFEERVKSFTSHFRIWHQLMRGSHEGSHEFVFNGKCKVLLINVSTPRRISSSWFTPPNARTVYHAHLPKNAKIWRPEEYVAEARAFHSSSSASSNTGAKSPNVNVEVIDPSRNVLAVAGMKGENCDVTCVRHKRRCDVASFPLLNDCVRLTRHFACFASPHSDSSKECGVQDGVDLPAYVDPSSPAELRPRACLINEKNRFVCDGSHPATRRLCPCV